MLTTPSCKNKWESSGWEEWQRTGLKWGVRAEDVCTKWLLLVRVFVFSSIKSVKLTTKKRNPTPCRLHLLWNGLNHCSNYSVLFKVVVIIIIIIIIITIISVMELGHLLTRSGLTYPEVSSKVYHDSFCQLDSSVALPWVIYFEAFCIHLHVCTVHQWRLEHFIIQQMHKYIIRRYN